MRDTVTVTADASDAVSGIASVVIQHRASGTRSAWTTLCTTAATPAACAWNTTAVADGGYDASRRRHRPRRLLHDLGRGQTIVANTLLVVLDRRPATSCAARCPSRHRVHNAGSLAYAVTIQYAVADSTTWKDVCKVGAAPLHVLLGHDRPGRAAAPTTCGRSPASGSSSTVSELVTDVLVDNTAPTVTMVDPGTPLRGTVGLTANATDNESGVAGVQLQYLRSGTSTWVTACTVEDEPYTCRFDTTALANGTYSFRAVATDAVGFVTTSAVVASRTVDNTVSSVSMENPGAVLTGTVTLAASASSTAGIASVRIERAPSGTTSWTTVCTDQTAPYSCSWNTTTVADGSYDFRAVLVDGRGVTTTSATMSSRRVDNSPLRGYDVQAVNGGGTVGRLDAGDVIRLTYSDQVRLDSISPGWTGAAVPVTVRVRDGNLLGLGSSGDTLDVLRGGASVNLGSVNLKQDFVKLLRTAQLNATMVATTSTVNGVPVTTVIAHPGQRDQRERAEDGQWRGRHGLDAVRGGDRPRRRTELHVASVRARHLGPGLLMRSTRVSRLAAAGLAVVVADMVVSLARVAAPAYLVLLVGAIGGVGLLVAGRLWRGACVGSRLTAILLAAAVITGQLLGASVGGPTGRVRGGTRPLRARSRSPRS